MLQKYDKLILANRPKKVKHPFQKGAFLWSSPSQVFWCARKLHPFWRFENCVPRNHARYAKWTHLWDFKLPGSTESGHAAGYSDKCEDVEDAGDRVARTEGWLMKIWWIWLDWGFQLDQGADPQMARCVSVWGGYRSHWISWGLLVGAHSTQKHIMMCFRVGVLNAQTMHLFVLKPFEMVGIP